jgi:glycerophosphoryl diester phosphodiesterase
MAMKILQVTKDGCPVIFHDNFIYTQQDVSLSIALFKCPTTI